MKRNGKLLILCFMLALITAILAGCSSGEEADSDGGNNMPVMPEELKAFVDDELIMVSDLAEALSGEWADDHAAFMARNLSPQDAMSSPEFYELKAVLDKNREELAAYYVYALLPNTDGNFRLTIDGSPEPDTIGANYGREIQFKEAWDGQPAAARSAWDDDVPCWSVFAPVYTSTEELACIIGIDYPCELANDYPEWNRDRDEWNGVEE